MLGFGLDKTMEISEAIDSLKNLYPETAEGGVTEKYFDERGPVVDELYGGRVSLQVRRKHLKTPLCKHDLRFFTLIKMPFG